MCLGIRPKASGNVPLRLNTSSRGIGAYSVKKSWRNLEERSPADRAYEWKGKYCIWHTKSGTCLWVSQVKLSLGHCEYRSWVRQRGADGRKLSVSHLQWNKWWRQLWILDEGHHEKHRKWNKWERPKSDTRNNMKQERMKQKRRLERRLSAKRQRVGGKWRLARWKSRGEFRLRPWWVDSNQLELNMHFLWCTNHISNDHYHMGQSRHRTVPPLQQALITSEALAERCNKASVQVALLIKAGRPHANPRSIFRDTFENTANLVKLYSLLVYVIQFSKIWC